MRQTIDLYPHQPFAPEKADEQAVFAVGSTVFRGLSAASRALILAARESGLHVYPHANKEGYCGLVFQGTEKRLAAAEHILERLAPELALRAFLGTLVTDAGTVRASDINADTIAALVDPIANFGKSSDPDDQSFPGRIRWSIWRFADLDPDVSDDGVFVQRHHFPPPSEL